MSATLARTLARAASARSGSSRSSGSSDSSASKAIVPRPPMPSSASAAVTASCQVSTAAMAGGSYAGECGATTRRARSGSDGRLRLKARMVPREVRVGLLRLGIGVGADAAGLVRAGGVVDEEAAPAVRRAVDALVGEAILVVLALVVLEVGERARVGGGAVGLQLA